MDGTGSGKAREDFATFQFIMWKSVFNVKTKVTVKIYFKSYYIGINIIKKCASSFWDVTSYVYM